MSGSVPAIWASATVGDICDPVAKTGPDKSKLTFKYVDLSSIDRATGKIAGATTVEMSAAPSRAKQVLKSGDVLFSNVRVYLENIAQVSPDLEGEIGSTAFCVLRPTGGINARYLYHYVSSRKFVLAVNALQRGNSPPSVQDSDVREQILPVAPTNEQHRIVSKIDELFSRIDGGEQALERVAKLVERYRQSVLKAAVTGELTRDWREARKRAGEPMESGAALLARILKARRAAWERAEIAKLKAKGKTPTDDRWKQKYQEPAPPNTTDLPELPEGWVWAGIDQVLQPTGDAMKTGPFGSLLKKHEHVSDGIPVLGIENVKARRFISGSNIHITLVKAAELVGYRVVPGDVLISRSGTVGDVCVVPEEIGDARISTNLMKMTLAQDGLLPDFFACQIYGSPTVLDRINAMCKGSTRSFLNQAILRAIAFALPPIREQQEAMRKIVSSEEDAESLVRDMHDGVRRATALRQSILKAAFCGQLVPQDPNDEPASKLLERIAAERANTAPPQRKRTRKTT
ncbi:MAG: hypothetical protein EPN31_05270 [Castellaniella sp.]|uniref:restriction endonuclease subunit S n=1 Tax=Castellaniella sp. TaxID=1955812 RepID=UPI0012207080|nr:restriction endonuclease subunit S [Castellaniella sp.]TAN29888.1 MAG: hypothetical protein EPN31_05270 [Castellaniella sp.]